MENKLSNFNGHLKKFKRKVRRNIEDYGIFITTKKLISYLFKPVFAEKRYIIYKTDIKNAQFNIKHENDFYFKVINEKDHDLIMQIKAMEEWLDEILESVSKDQWFCLVAFDDMKVVGFNLVVLDEMSIPSINFRKPLEPGEAWSQQITVHKDYRRKGLATELRYRTFEELMKLGIRRFYGAALSWNKQSLKLAERVGFKPYLDVRYHKRLFSKKIYCKEMSKGNSPFACS